MTDIGLMVRSANPVPDETQALTNDELSAVLLLAQQRSGDMSTKEAVRPIEQEPKPKWPGWLIAAAAFAVVLGVVGIAYVFSSSTSDVPPATTPTTVVPPTTVASPPTSVVPPTTASSTALAASPEELAVIEEYEAAVNAADADAVRGLLGPGFGHTDAGNPGWVSRADLWSRQEAYWAAEGGTVAHTDCHSEGALVSCLETWSGPVQDVVLLQDWTYRMRFDIQDGVIVAMEGYALVWPDQSVDQDIRARIAAWVRTFDDELGVELERCSGGAAGENFDLDLAAQCGEYAVLWAEAGRP